MRVWLAYVATWGRGFYFHIITKLIAVSRGVGYKTKRGALTANNLDFNSHALCLQAILLGVISLA